MTKVKYSEDVVGCKIGNVIYLHPDLKFHPGLKKAILKHENKHSDTLEWKDFWMDLYNEDLTGYKKEYYKFLLTHPKTWKGFLPISKFEGTLTVDVSMILIYVFAIIVAWGLIVLL